MLFSFPSQPKRHSSALAFTGSFSGDTVDGIWLRPSVPQAMATLLFRWSSIVNDLGSASRPLPHPAHLGRTISALWEPYFDEASIRSLSTRILTRLARILRQRPRTLVLVWYMTAGVPVLRAVSTTLCQAFAPSIAKACR